MMKKLALIQPAALQAWERGEVVRVRACVAAERGGLAFEWTDSTAEADLVVLLESCSFKTRHDIPAYRALLAEHGATRLVCLNYEDAPPGFLPGLYSSLESFRFDDAMHRSWPHLRMPNALADEGPMAFPSGGPDLLFSFAGACSHPLRRKLFDAFEGHAGRHHVVEIKRWYNHDASEKQAYVRDISRSQFVLCPRGIASYSHRIVETMALGRIPVVIADDWVPFSIPEEGYFLRVPERAIGDLEPIIDAAAASYDALVGKTRSVYARWFSPEVRYRVALNRLCELHTDSTERLNDAELSGRWASAKFWRSNQWAFDQRVIRRLRQAVNL